MKPIVSSTHETETVEMRAVYAKTMTELFAENPKIICLDADLMYASGMRDVWTKHPENVIECGVAEANMVGVGAGLAKEGWVPFMHTFAAFSTRRALDQFYMSCAYSGLNVKLLGSDPGIASALNGGTHSGIEDIAHVRPIPTLTIIDPADSTMFKWVLRTAAETEGLFYIRMFRTQATKIYEEGSVFELGKAVTLRDGKDVTIISAGIEVAEALQAADLLEKEGVSARVLDMFTIKPIDEDAIVSAAKETGAIVTAENHSIIGGLGGAVAEVLAEKYPAPLERIGIRDVFGEVGPLPYLKKQFELTAEDIVKKAKVVMARKTN